MQVGEFQLRLIAQRGEQHGHFTQLHPPVLKRDGYFLVWEIDLRLPEAGLEPEQIFQQPHTGDAMDRRNVEGHSGEALVGKIHQPLAHRGFIQKVELPLVCPNLDADIRSVPQVVEVTEPAFGQEIKDDPASLAAEYFLVSSKGPVRTARPT